MEGDNHPNGDVPRHQVGLRKGKGFFYDKFLELSESRYAVWSLGFVSFVNSTFFPIPQDALLLPMMLSNPGRSFFYASISLVFSCLGGIFGYMIGYFLYDSLGRTILEFYSYQDKIQELKSIYDQHGIWILILVGVSPFPYKIITIMSGFLSYNFGLFVVGSILGRSIRFYFYVLLFYFFGEKIIEIVDRFFGYFVMIFVLTLFLVFSYTLML